MCLQNFPVMIIICFSGAYCTRIQCMTNRFHGFLKISFFDADRWTAPCRWCAWERSATSPGCSSCVMTWSPWKHWCMRRRATWASHSRSCSSSATSTSSTCWWRMWVLFSIPFLSHSVVGCFFLLLLDLKFVVSQSYFLRFLNLVNIVCSLPSCRQVLM